MRKTHALAIAILATALLAGCGGSSGSSSTVVMGALAGEAGTLTGVTLKASLSSEGYSDQTTMDAAGSFSFAGAPVGLVEIEVLRSGETTSLKTDVTTTRGSTTEVDVYIMTWTPEPVAEFKSRTGSGSFGAVRPVGPDGTTMTVETDGSRKYTTLKGLEVTRKPDGSVEVDSTNYTP